MSNSDNNPLGDRGRADEERWAREQQAEAIEKLKKAGQKDGTAAGGDKPAGEGAKDCPCKNGAKKCDCKAKGGSKDCACGGGCGA